MEVFKLAYKNSPILFLFIGLIVVPVIFILGNGYSYLLNTKPTISGNISVAGIQAPVQIETDAQGVKHIIAQYDNDAFFAMGVIHAQDRLWQLELQRRMATGTLSEIFGKDAVNLDIYMRTMGISKNTNEAWDSLGRPAQNSLEAYSAGINSWLDSAQSLPVEFSIMGIQPQRWHPSHSLAWYKMFGLGLAGNFQKDIQRLVISKLLSAEKAQLLMTNEEVQETKSTVNASKLATDSLTALNTLNSQLQNEWGIGGKNVGSNAWVLSGKHTKNDLATLASDPHLAIQLPSYWYTVSLKGEKLDVTGASLVGLPIIMQGKNANIGWSSTNMMADTMDLYYEEINLANNNQYRRGDSWIDFETSIETINVKADFPSILREPLKPLKIKVRSTEYGPIISDVVDVFKQPVSLRWAGNEEKDTSYEAFFALNYAHDWVSFNKAMNLLITPVVNMFYVDAQQNIGQLGAGRVPIRGKGQGSIPVPGWDLEYAWQGYIPIDQMPQSFNPPQGYLISANNKVVSNGGDHFISRDWAGPHRANRIENLIKAKLDKSEKISLADQQSMQMDMFDEEVLVILPTLINLKTSDEHVNQMLNILRDWDGSTGPESIGTTVFFTLMRHLRPLLLNDEFEDYWGRQNLKSIQQAFINDMSITQINDLLNSETVNWCDRLSSNEKESCENIQIEAMQETYEELEGLLGDDISDWTWGAVHHVLFVHRPFSSIKGLDIIFEREIAKGGSPNSINMSEFSFKQGKGYYQMVGSSYRQIIQFSDNKQDYFYQNSTGQSGNLVSDHYDDSIETFANGDYHLLVTGQNEVVKTLNLVVPKTAD
ncbi:penicillin acylase family protein [Pseudoalteromonas sp. SCSIO 43210]